MSETVWPLHIIFDGPPGHESGRFVEVNDATGKSVNAGEWVENGPFWELIIQAPGAKPPLDPRDPDHSRQGIFVNHNCSYCHNGELPCRQGDPNRCGNPMARND
jgi:hypothetical protein